MRKNRAAHFVDVQEIVNNAKNRFPDDEKSAEQLANFSITLNKLMEEQGKHQDKMAKDLHISTGVLSNYRNGKSEPGLTSIVQIANYLNVSCTQLMTGISDENRRLNSRTGLSNDALSFLKRINSNGNAEEKQTIDLINRVLSDPGRAPGSVLLDMTLFSWIEKYITCDTAHLYASDRDSIPIQTKTGVIEDIEPSFFYGEALKARIINTIEKYREAEKGVSK